MRPLVMTGGLMESLVSQNVRRWGVQCPMSDELVTLPNYQITHLVAWSLDTYI
jgi:hypothetical protein